MLTRRVILGTVLLSCVSLGAVSAATPVPLAQGPWLGVWQLNLQKSTFQLGKPTDGTVRTYTMTAAGPDSFDIVSESRSPDGVITLQSQVRGGRFDGQDYRESGSPIADANRFQLLGPRSYSFVQIRGGRPVSTVTVEISADGLTRTSRQESTGPDGQSLVNVSVWDRQ